MPPSPLTRVRKLALALPDAHEELAWGEPTFRVKNKIFAMYASANTHHGYGTNSVWVKATPINQGFMVKAKPRRFFVPPYVGPNGWIGVRLDGRVNWGVVADLLKDAYDLTLPKTTRRRR